VQFISQHLAPDEIRGLQELFASMDTDGSGTIALDELRQGLASRGAALPEAELAALMDLADVDHSRELDYQEFVAATMHACKVQHEQLLIEAFQVRPLVNDQLVRFGCV
jgi:calcium-dependent protein kinase